MGRFHYLRYRGVPEGFIRHISGFPIVGSVLVVLLLPAFYDSRVLLWIGGVIAFLDTGGLHVFVCAMIYAVFKGQL